LEKKEAGVEACVVEKVPKYKEACAEPDLLNNGFTIFRHSTGKNGKVGMSPCFYMRIEGKKVEGKDLKKYLMQGFNVKDPSKSKKNFRDKWEGITSAPLAGLMQTKSTVQIMVDGLGLYKAATEARMLLSTPAHSGRSSNTEALLRSGIIHTDLDYHDYQKILQICRRKQRGDECGAKCGFIITPQDTKREIVLCDNGGNTKSFTITLP